MLRWCSHALVNFSINGSICSTPLKAATKRSEPGMNESVVTNFVVPSDTAAVVGSRKITRKLSL